MHRLKLSIVLLAVTCGLFSPSLSWSQDAAPAPTPDPTTPTSAPASSSDTPASTPAVDTSAPPPAEATKAADSSSPAPSSTVVLKALPPPRIVITQPSPPLPLELVFPPPGGPVEEYVGHRKTDNDGSGWGWIKKPNEDWKKARWVTLRESAKIPAPWRALGKKNADENFEYKIWGYFADHKVYDPIYDELLDVFVLDHYESLGAAAPIIRQSGPDDRFATQRRPSRAGSRDNRPMQTDNQAF